jgi:hypothetical protein
MRRDALRAASPFQAPPQAGTCPAHLCSPSIPGEPQASGAAPRSAIGNRANRGISLSRSHTYLGAA